MEKQETYIGKRYEFKYILGPRAAAMVERDVCALSRVVADPYSAHGPYTVNSLYFDTPLLDDYRDKDGSFLERKKLRARIYKPEWSKADTLVWLEVKHKRNMNIEKQRVQISADEWEKFREKFSGEELLQRIKGGNTKEKEALESFLYLYKRGLYRPSITVRYLRSAYVEQFISLVRVSFDKDIHVARPEESGDRHAYMPISRNLAIMEIKFHNKMPWWFKRLISSYNLERTDFSKYRNSVAMFRGRYRIPIYK